MYEKKVYADYVDCRCTRKLPRKCGDSPRKGKAWYVSCLKHGIWAMVIPALLEILLLAMGYGIQLLTTAPFMQVLRGRAHHQGWKVTSRADRGQMGQESKLITHHSFRLSTIAMLRSVFVRAQALNLFATCPFRWKQLFPRHIARGKDRGQLDPFHAQCAAGRFASLPFSLWPCTPGKRRVPGWRLRLPWRHGLGPQSARISRRP